MRPLLFISIILFLCGCRTAKEVRTSMQDKSKLDISEVTTESSVKTELSTFLDLSTEERDVTIHIVEYDTEKAGNPVKTQTTITSKEKRENDIKTITEVKDTTNITQSYTDQSDLNVKTETKTEEKDPFRIRYIFGIVLIIGVIFIVVFVNLKD